MTHPHTLSSTLTPSFFDALVATSVACAGVLLAGPSASLSATALPFCGAAMALALSGLAGAPIVRALKGRGRSAASEDRVGHYILGAKIGQGGMGEVYRARHAMMDRDVAIKILPKERDDEEGRLRFEREVQLTSRLESANTVAIHDSGRTPDGRFYYVMELVEGHDLESLVVRCGPQPASRVVHILKQVCAALDEAHAAGLVHRDIKPANLALCERAGVKGVVKVLDFGLADEVGKRSTPALVGTPAYMAPETIRSSAAVDGRADLYALGAVAYWLLTGTQVFGGDSIVEICSHHLYSTPQSPSARLGSSIPADLEAVLLRCLAKDPDERPASARALLEALEACGCADDQCAAAPQGSWSDEGLANDDAGAPSIGPRSVGHACVETAFGADVWLPQAA